MLSSSKRIKFLAIVILLYFTNPIILPGQSGPLNPGGIGIIAFTSDRDGNHEIYLMNADGSSQINITNSSAEDFVEGWSKDGNRLAFTSTRDGAWEIYIMDMIDISNGIFTEPQRITFNNSMAMSVTWSPDGNKIAFDSQVEGIFGIYIYDLVNGGEFQRLDTSPVNGYQPSWSPNDDVISFASQSGIYTINANGTGLQQLTTENCNVPVWSPDGNRITFVAGTPDEDIYIVNSDGTGLVNITTNPYNDFVPSWSFDGNMFVYEDDRYGHDEICTIDIFGWSHQRLTSEGTNTNPVWWPGFVSSVNDGQSDSVPTEFKLMQNYPNPFNPSTIIEYSIPIESNVSIKIYDIIGNEVATLVDDIQPAGNYSIRFDASGLASGVYLYNMKALNGITLTKKIVVQK